MRNHKVFFGFSAICWLVIAFGELPRFSAAEISGTLVEPEIRRRDRDHRPRLRRGEKTILNAWPQFMFCLMLRPHVFPFHTKGKSGSTWGGGGL